MIQKVMHLLLRCRQNAWMTSKILIEGRCTTFALSNDEESGTAEPTEGFFIRVVNYAIFVGDPFGVGLNNIGPVTIYGKVFVSAPQHSFPVIVVGQGVWITWTPVRNIRP